MKVKRVAGVIGRTVMAVKDADAVKGSLQMNKLREPLTSCSMPGCWNIWRQNKAHSEQKPATPEASIFERAILGAHGLHLGACVHWQHYRIPLDELPPWGDQDSQGNNAGSSEKSRSPLASQGNRVVLLGDALHAAHSGPGQGARTAFEQSLHSRQKVISSLAANSLASTPLQDAHQLANILEAHSQELNSWKLPKALQPSVTRGDSCSQKGSDAEGLPRVVADYTKARLVRVCRMQRMAAEGSGLPHIR
eukprot:1145956-Pelagomonas_calceolata.AAC.6